jgi:hypothetical protein
VARSDRDLAFVRFEPALWRLLGPDLDRLKAICEGNLAAYYERHASE